MGRRWLLKKHHRWIVPSCQRVAPPGRRLSGGAAAIAVRAGRGSTGFDRVQRGAACMPDEPVVNKQHVSATVRGKCGALGSRQERRGPVSPADRRRQRRPDWVERIGTDGLLNSGNPVVLVDGVSLRRAYTPAPLDTGAEPHQAKVAILSELHEWSGGVMRFRHPPGSWLTRNCTVRCRSSTSLNHPSSWTWRRARSSSDRAGVRAPLSHIGLFAGPDGAARRQRISQPTVNGDIAGPVPLR